MIAKGNIKKNVTRIKKFLKFKFIVDSANNSPTKAVEIKNNLESRN